MPFKPQQPINQIAGHRYTVEGELVPHDYTLRDNWYHSFKMATDAESRAAYLASWTTKEGREFNRNHTACPRCHGKGATRKDASIGCHVCKGTGTITVVPT